MRAIDTRCIPMLPRTSALFIALFFSNTTLSAGQIVYPSAKYPDFPFSEAVAYNGVLYLSGEIGTDAEGKLADGGIGPESRQTMENIKATLGRHDLTMQDILKCTVFLAEISEWPLFNNVYAGYFEKGRYPARSAMAASGLAMGARVEVECIAALNNK